MYEVGTTIYDIESSPNKPNEIFTREYYYDGYNNITYDGDKEIYEPFVKLNGEIVSVNELNKTDYSRPENVIELINGNGCLTTMAYQLADITYNIENEVKTTNISSTHYLYALK
jgi:hypothetical protein